MRDLGAPRAPRVARYTLLAVWLASCAASAGAGDANVRFDRLSTEEGLSQTLVYTILQDRRGFLWIATQEGLNRFDGYRFTVFKHDRDDPTTLSNNAVWALAEDPDGSLWAGTDGGGLNQLQPSQGTFTAFRHNPADPKSLANDRVRALLRTREGVLWAGTDGGGVSRLERETGTFVHFRHDAGNPNSLSSDRVRSLFEDRDGAIWIATDGGGLNRFDPVTGRVQRFRHDSADPNSIGHDRVRSVFQDRDGAIWVATYEAGLSRFERGRFEHFRHDPANPDSLSGNRVRVLMQDRAGTLWIGTDGGLDQWQPEARRFVHLRHDPTNRHSLDDDRVTALFQDKGGVLWVGTQGGLNKWHMATRAFELHRVRPSAASSLSSNAVNAIVTEGPNVVWIGTHAGLNRLDRRTGQFTQYKHDPKNPRSLSDHRVMSLLVDRSGRLWAGTYENGLNLLDRERGTFTRYRHDPNDATSLGGNGITSILEGRHGALWVGVYRGGLNRFEPATGRATRFRHDPKDPTSLAHDAVISLHEDARGGLWVGTDRAGLDYFDAATGRFTHHRHDPKNPASLGSDTVFAIHEDRRGTLWIGTQGGGLSRWEAADRKAGRAVFRHYGERDGLPSMSVYGILEDYGGDLWLSTMRGVARLDPIKGTFRNFDTRDGLASHDFNFGAYHRAPSGEMFFGSNAGFNAFHPERILRNTHVPPVVLTSLAKLNREEKITDVQDIRLTHKDYVVSFEFAALDFATSDRNRYAYRLEGLDRDWVQSGTERRATYTNLAPGHYVFRVKASNGDGVWNEDGLAVRVRVLPPPWRTWWAYGLYALLIVAALGAYARAQARKLKREAEYSRRLEEEVRVRTSELKQRNVELQHANRKLEDASLCDSLTGLNNRRFLMTQVQQDVAVVERYYRKIALGVDVGAEDRPDFALMMIDLDGLKGLNDYHGHAAGDQALVQMRDILERACRKSDTIVRWGGDEFLVLARYVDGDMTAALAERIRRAVEEHSFEVGGPAKVHLRCSIGWALYPLMPVAPRLVTWEQVGTIADRALYAAKSSGRNAWVGLLSTLTTPIDDTVHLITHRPRILVQEGALEVRSSLGGPDAIVWDRNAVGTRPTRLPPAASLTA